VRLCPRLRGFHLRANELPAVKASRTLRPCQLQDSQGGHRRVTHVQVVGSIAVGRCTLLLQVAPKGVRALSCNNQATSPPRAKPFGGELEPVAVSVFERQSSTRSLCPGDRASPCPGSVIRGRCVADRYQVGGALSTRAAALVGNSHAPKQGRYLPRKRSIARYCIVWFALSATTRAFAVAPGT